MQRTSLLICAKSVTDCPYVFMESLTVNKPSGADDESAHLNTLVRKQATGNTIIFAGVKIKQTRTNKQTNQTNATIRFFSCFFFFFKTSSVRHAG